MGTDSSDFLKSILEKIDDYFADEIGPVAAILCEESRAFWIQKVKRQNVRPGLRNIYFYVNQLATHIDDEQAKKVFLDKVYSIESLKILKDR